MEVGDYVHVRGHLVTASDTIATVRFNGETEIPVLLKNIVHVEPRPFRAGDFVVYRKTEWRIMAAEADMLWIRLGSEAEYASVHQSEVQRRA